MPGKHRKRLKGPALEPVASEVLDHFVGHGPITPEELETTVRRFKKALIERALGGELTHHLGYPPGGTKPDETTNHRNGTSEKTVRASQEQTSQVIFVFAQDGRCALLSEHGLDFSCLGPHMQPVRTANMGILAKLLRERAPHAYFDERLMRLGRRPLPFVVGGTVQVSGGGASQTRVNTAQGMDVLAEVLRQAVALGLLT